MTELASQTDEVTLEGLARELERWDDEPAGALALRAGVRRLADPRRPGATVAETAILAARRAYRDGDPQRLSRAATRDPRLTELLGPFVGDPELGPWPFADALRLSDENAALWLPLLRRAVPDKAIRTFVQVMLRTRRRNIWMPAAEAFGAQAVRDGELREALSEAFRRCFPGGLPEEWPCGQMVDGGEEALRLARRILPAACAYAARGGDLSALPGYSVDKLLALSLPGDAACAAALLLGLDALLGGEHTRAPALAMIPRRIAELPPDDWADAVLRRMAERIDHIDAGSEAMQAILTRLCAPVWRDGREFRRLDGLWSWLETARWLVERKDTTALERMRAAAGAAATAFAFRVSGGLPGDAERALEELLPRLRCLADDVLYDTTPAVRRAALCAETLALLEHPELGALPWSKLVLRATDGKRPADLLEGKVTEVARAQVLLWLDRHHPGVAPAAWLRDTHLPADVVLHISARQSRPIATQAALQMERLLREAPPGEAQLKLLWRLLERNPPGDTFRELLAALRGHDTPLHHVVAKLAQLDEIRDLERPVIEAAIAYGELAALSRQLLPADAPALPHEPLARSLAAALLAPTPPEPGSDAWLAAMRDILLGREPGAGLEAVLAWLGSPRATLAPEWAKFESTTQTLRAAQAPDDDAVSPFLLALGALRNRIGDGPWPESDLVRRMLDEGERWAGRREEGLRAERQQQAAERSQVAAAAERISGLLDRGAESELTELVRAGDHLDHLDPELVRRLHRYLLNVLLFRTAHHLRQRVNHRVALPAVWTHLAPLIVGVAGGPILILDVGQNWNEIVNDHPFQYAVTIALALIGGFFLLTAQLASHLPPHSQRTSLFRRVLPTFLLTLVLSFTSSAVVLWTLGDTVIRRGIDPAAQVALWTPLSLFLGLFVGIIAQGRSVARGGR